MHISFLHDLLQNYTFMHFLQLYVSESKSAMG